MNYSEIISEFFPNTLITSSKGQYNWDHPDNFVVFNSRFYLQKGSNLSVIWKGDIDITKSWQKIIKLYEKLDGDRLFICYENTESILYEVEKEHCFSMSPAGASIGPKIDDLYKFEGENIIYVPQEPEPPEVKKEREDELKNSYDQQKYKTLVDFKVVMSSKQKKDPLSKFWTEIQKLAPIKSVDEVYLSQDAYEDLKKQFKKWAKRKYNYLTEYRLDSSIEWTFFDSAPSHFLVNPDWVETSMVYLKIKDVP